MAQQRNPVSFRWSRKTIEELRRHADLRRDSQTELAERYVREGMRIDDHPLIVFRDRMAGRRPALVGSRLDVADVVATLRQNDNSIEATAEYLDLPVASVDAAVRYYAEFPDEVDRDIAAAAAVTQREHALWQRRREALR
jgi:uncharacterized protein (DUF433 family)